VLKGIGGVFTLRIENSHSRRHHLVRHVVVADDEIYALLFGIRYLLDGLDATVKYDNEFYPCFCCIVYSLLADTIALFLAVGDIVVDVGIELLQELVD
jgi:hypothetical protein